ncbi:MAG: chloride channel protein, partial [Anaerolineae bacterium]
PHVFGSGFATIQQALLGELPWGLLLALVLLKPLATSLTLGSGNSGGVFAPSLFLGAALGGAFGHAVGQLTPGGTAGVGAFAAVGMAAVFAAAARAPLTAILIVFEMTDDYYLIVPLMAGVIVSYILAEHLHPESIYTLKLTRRGIRLRRGRDVDVLSTVRVEEVMVREPITVPLDMPVLQLVEEFLRTGRHGFPVLDAQGRLYGMVSLEDYRRVAQDSQIDSLNHTTVKDIATRDVISVFPDDSVDLALRRMAPRDLGRLPVVARDNPQRLLGVVRRNDILRAYELGVVRRETVRQHAEQIPSSKDGDTEFVSILVTPDAGIAGKTIADLLIPRGAVLVSIRRGNELLIPRGDTVLQPGDIVLALCQRQSVNELRAALQRSSASMTSPREAPNVDNPPAGKTARRK